MPSVSDYTETNLYIGDGSQPTAQQTNPGIRVVTWTGLRPDGVGGSIMDQAALGGPYEHDPVPEAYMLRSDLSELVYPSNGLMTIPHGLGFVDQHLQIGIAPVLIDGSSTLPFVGTVATDTAISPPVRDFTGTPGTYTYAFDSGTGILTIGFNTYTLVDMVAGQIQDISAPGVTLSATAVSPITAAALGAALNGLTVVLVPAPVPNLVKADLVPKISTIVGGTLAVGAIAGTTDTTLNDITTADGSPFDTTLILQNLGGGLKIHDSSLTWVQAKGVSDMEASSTLVLNFDLLGLTLTFGTTTAITGADLLTALAGLTIITSPFDAYTFCRNLRSNLINAGQMNAS